MRGTELIRLKCPQCNKVCKVSKGWQEWEWTDSDKIRDVAESLSSHLQSERHNIAENAADQMACETAMMTYPGQVQLWRQPPQAAARDRGPGSSYEPAPPPPPPLGPAPATNSRPPLPPAQQPAQQEEESSEEEAQDNPWADLDPWHPRRQAPAAAGTPALAVAPTPRPAAAATPPAPAAAAWATFAVVATPAQANTGGLTFRLPDLASATDDQLVATVGILTDQLHRVYREMQIRIQIRQNAPPPADLLA